MNIETFVYCLDDEDGIWLPMVITMESIVAIKLSSPNTEEFCYNKTTVYTKYGEAFVIDENYYDFSVKFKEYKNGNNRFEWLRGFWKRRSS